MRGWRSACRTRATAAKCNRVARHARRSPPSGRPPECSSRNFGGTRSIGPRAEIANLGLLSTPSSVTPILPPRGMAPFATRMRLSSSLTLFLGSSQRGPFHSKSGFSFLRKAAATVCASPVSITIPADPAAPKAIRANCSLAEAFRALARISFMASSSAPPSSNSSSPLLMAPTGEMMSWHTLLHRRAARSVAESVKMSAIENVQSPAITVLPGQAAIAVPASPNRINCLPPGGLSGSRASRQIRPGGNERMCGPDRGRGVKSARTGLRSATFM